MKLIALLLLPIVGFGQIKLDNKLSLLDNKVEISLPKELSKMSDTMWSYKYHRLPRPALVMTDENGEINLLLNLTNQAATESQLSEYADLRVANLKKTRTDIKILDQGVKVVNGKKVGFIKFSSVAVDQNIFNYYFFTVLDGKIIFFTFNCIEKLQKTWESVAEDILNSLKVK